MSTVCSMNSNHSNASHLLSTNINQANLADIAPVFNLIQEYSYHDYFNNLYLQPRYQAGLGIQLFSILFFGYIRLPDSTWHQTNMLVAKNNNELLGFIIIRKLPGPCDRHEIYMCAINDLYRRQGLGKRLIKAAIANLPKDSILEAECLPKARQMKQLLLNFGFELVGDNKKNGTEKFVGQVSSIQFDDWVTGQASDSVAKFHQCFIEFYPIPSAC